MSGCYYYDERGNRCECYPSETADKLLAAMERNAKLEELVRDIAKHHFVTTDDARRIAELGIEVDG